MDQNLIIFIFTRHYPTLSWCRWKRKLWLSYPNWIYRTSLSQNLLLVCSSRIYLFLGQVKLFIFGLNISLTFLCWNRDRLGMIIAHLWYLIDKRWYAGDANQSVHLVASEGLEAYLPLADMVDISAEVQRLTKRLAKMQTEYDGLMARLSSPSVSSIQNHLIRYL